jgi:hypothetical protein
MEPVHKIAAVTEREQRLIGLLRRQVRLNDDLRAENEYLRGLLRRLSVEHRVTCERHAAEIVTADVLCGAAMRELLTGGDQEA